MKKNLLLIRAEVYLSYYYFFQEIILNYGGFNVSIQANDCSGKS